MDKFKRPQVLSSDGGATGTDGAVGTGGKAGAGVGVGGRGG